MLKGSIGVETTGNSPSLTLCGFMACGKSALGRRLAAALHYDFVDTDQLLLERTGMTLQQMFAKGGEAYFRDREHEVIREAARLPRTVISTGGGVMTFERNARLLAESTRIIHVHRPFDACYASISRRKNRPIAGQKSREELLALYNARLDAYNRYANFVLHNDGTPEQAVERVLRWLGAQHI